ncbi:MAG: DUF192 domain-containing protein [Alphaproteobacteria bacterium]|nr:DUF192 domain-containing protein [Alphaproteobacteria bacterium]
MLSRRALCASLVLLPLAASAQQGLQTFDRTKLDIETKAGKYSFDIELALTPEQQAQGLMYRQKLATDAGMLFLYDHEQPLLMWMANTFIPLDMLFIAADGKIVNIAERTVPHSTVTIGSGALAQAVLELNGGTSARLGIGVGDRVVYAAFTLRR